MIHPEPPADAILKRAYKDPIIGRK